MSEALRDYYRDAFRATVKTLPGVELPWLRSARRHAFERFETLGFPGTQLEAWKYTNVTPIAQPCWHFAPAHPAPADLGGIAGLVGDLVPDEAASRLVFVNGRCVPKLSRLADLPAGAWVGSLRQAMREMRAAPCRDGAARVARRLRGAERRVPQRRLRGRAAGRRGDERAAPCAVFRR
ncbi:hypothetical protein [Paraburkholderia sp. A1RO-1]|uniref:hypothetical protein n=1 Tax=Paraburkholderia sp. A1RO-1 TaxID=3028368 RepID=UPI003B7821D1